MFHPRSESNPESAAVRARLSPPLRDHRNQPESRGGETPRKLRESSLNATIDIPKVQGFKG
jgi:hypothetical protein